MSSTGLDGAGGTTLTGFDRVRASVACILTTRKGSRVMRRDFGSEIPDLLDRPMNERVILAIYVAAVAALRSRKVNGREYGEPCFSPTRMNVRQLTANGEIELVIWGDYYPRGHLGDFSVAEEVKFDVALSGGARPTIV
jgi:hypothetical protein